VAIDAENVVLVEGKLSKAAKFLALALTCKKVVVEGGLGTMNSDIGFRVPVMRGVRDD